MNKDGGAKGFGAGGSALWPKQSNPAPVEAEKELPDIELFVATVDGKQLSVKLTDYPTAIARLIAWRDKAVVAELENMNREMSRISDAPTVLMWVREYCRRRIAQLGAKDE